MSDIVIKVENLWKQYRYGIVDHTTLKRDLQRWWARLRGKDDPNLLIDHEQSAKSKTLNSDRHASNFIPQYSDSFWAIRDISFEIRQGEVLGIIGKNGAGKSTLLKIMSRVTTPTKGQVKIKGRVASLLEVGTGFHPELTGKENIFLNGAILGMSKNEIRKKFDEIVAFAEIEKFINTPVKRYSSGMYVRLAFAVAAHLEPEILIVDEVLAVGDIGFQKKCLGKVKRVSEEGRTVLFVSHNMDAISTLCSKGILLNDGRISYMGGIPETILQYKSGFLSNQVSVDNCFSRGGSGGVRITNVWISNEKMETKDKITSSEPVFINMTVTLGSKYQNSKNLNIGFAIDSLDGRRLWTAVSAWENKEIVARGDDFKVGCWLSSVPLVPEKYLVSASISYQGDTLDCLVHCARFEILQDNSSFYIQRDKEFGDLHIPFRFEAFDV